MEKQLHKYDKDQRVKLLGDPSNLYPLAGVGSEGWVRRLDHDSLGYPIIYVEWDKDHWTYNGERDEWTLEAHFEAVKEEEMAEPKKDDDPLQRLLEEALKGEQSPTKDRNVIRTMMESVKWPSKHALTETLTEAARQATNDEAFMLITVHKDEDGNLIPTIASCFTSPESAILLEAQLSRLAAIAHSDLAGNMIHGIMEERNNG